MRYILQRELTDLASNVNINSYNDNLENVLVRPRPPPGSSSSSRGGSSSGSSSSRGRGNTAWKLPLAVSPIAAREADGDTFCAEGVWFKDQVVASSVITGGWKWVDEATIGSLKYCDHFNCRKLGYRANGVGKSLDILVSNMLCNVL
jgi:hypothetical protein